jgi:hypothetical protein
MPVQPQLFPDSVPDSTPGAEPVSAPPHPETTLRQSTPSGAPVWLQRTSLFVLVLFCVYLGVLVMVLPWWPRMWDQNMFLLAHPQLSHFLHLGAVRGVISGLGAIDIWIGISEAIHYRETR